MKLIMIAVIVVLSSFVFADEGGFGQLSISCQAVTTTGACTSFNVHPPDFVHIPQANSFTWQTIFAGGTPTSDTVRLEGSIDGTTWNTIDTSTSTAGETRSKTGTAYNYFRCYVAAYLRNGTTLTCQITPAQAQVGVGVTDFSDLTGTATDVQIPNDITIDHAATADTATALAANGANCSAGQAPLGVDASGASEGCFTPGGAGNNLVNSQKQASTVTSNGTTPVTLFTTTLPARAAGDGVLIDLGFKHSTGATSTTYTLNYGSYSQVILGPSTTALPERILISIMNDSGVQNSQQLTGLAQTDGTTVNAGIRLFAPSTQDWSTPKTLTITAVLGGAGTSDVYTPMILLVTKIGAQ